MGKKKFHGLDITAIASLKENKGSFFPLLVDFNFEKQKGANNGNCMAIQRASSLKHIEVLWEAIFIVRISSAIA